MKDSGEGVIERLVSELMKLPGIGRKTAQRLVFHMLKRPPEQAEALARALLAVREQIRACATCFNLAEAERCAICSDPRREQGRICVVEEPANVTAIERTGAYKGLYHVLGGSLSPLAGVGPDDLRIRELVERVKAGGVEEVILATNPTVEGEATAIHIARTLKGSGARLTRIAQGLPVGGDLEYADEVTLHRALEGRREVE
jgi:recombination protein RecR